VHILVVWHCSVSCGNCPSSSDNQRLLTKMLGIVSTVSFVALLTVNVAAFAIPNGRRPLTTCSQLHMSSTPDLARDLTGQSLWVTFTGFGVENMNFGIELKPAFEAAFSRGLESASPGVWRVVKYEDGRETVEVTQPVLPEYMFFFDIWEKQILWRGQIDPSGTKVFDGVVQTNKKRFGIFPYTETLATFTANILERGEKLPDVELPKFRDLSFVVSACTIHYFMFSLVISERKQEPHLFYG
jgi:hypothetical protein